MSSRLRYLLALIACSFITVAGLAVGVFASCDGNSCQVDVTGCTPLHQPFQDNCCRQDAGGLHRCYTCWRDYYWCMNSLVAGTAYNCTNAGAYCS